MRDDNFRAMVPARLIPQVNGIAARGFIARNWVSINGINRRRAPGDSHRRVVVEPVCVRGIIRYSNLPGETIVLGNCHRGLTSKDEWHASNGARLIRHIGSAV